MKQFKRNLTRKFTYWYIKKGYTFKYKDGEAVFDCPWWIRSLLIFFSPSIYIFRKCGEIFCESFIKGLREASETLNAATEAINNFSAEVKSNKENEAGVDI